MNEASCDMLYFDGVAVARLSGIFEDQGTWFADYALEDQLSESLHAFIRFNCEQLSEGTFEDDALANYAQFLNTDKWSVLKHGDACKIKGAPLFRETDLSWVE
jgi:hypothetical protein